VRQIGSILYGVFMCSATFAQESQLHSEFRLEGRDISKDCGSLKSIFSCLQEIVTGHPLRFTAASIAPQNGMGLGAAFVYDEEVSERWRLNINADAVASENQSWRAGVYLKAIRTPSRPVKVTTTRPNPTDDLHRVRRPATIFESVPELNFYSQAISLNKVDYYGLGQFTSHNSLASFGQREVITGGNVTWPLYNTGLALFGELNGRWVDLRSRPDGAIPSIGQVFTNVTAPGLAHQPGFLESAEGLKFAPDFSDTLRLKYSAVIQEFAAIGDSQYSFRRLNLDFVHDIAMYRQQRSAPASEAVGPDQSPASLEAFRYNTRNLEGTIELEARLVESFTGQGQQVPLYFQPTLGGADINGEKMLASYPDYRFRAPNLMLFRASIEHSIWGPIGVIASADTGKVAIKRGELGFDHLRHSYGVGLTIRAGGFPVVQLLFAWGGHEGTHTLATIDPVALGGGLRPPLY
jgi:hypothetical protein